MKNKKMVTEKERAHSHKKQTLCLANWWVVLTLFCQHSLPIYISASHSKNSHSLHHCNHKHKPIKEKNIIMQGFNSHCNNNRKTKQNKTLLHMYNPPSIQYSGTAKLKKELAQCPPHPCSIIGNPIFHPQEIKHAVYLSVYHLYQNMDLLSKRTWISRENGDELTCFISLSPMD